MVKGCYNLINHQKEVISLPEDTPAPVAGKSDDNLIAAISYLWILSIIILLVKKDSDYVRFHARQGVVLFGAFIIVSLLSVTLSLLSMGFIIVLLNLVIFVAIIVGFIQAYQGKRYKMPVVGDLAEKINF